MNFLDQTAQELRERLAKDPCGQDIEGYAGWVEDTAGFVREKLLESYKNGIKAANRRGQNRNKNGKSQN